MNLLFYIIPIATLVFLTIFLLGWIWPLTAGIIKTRRGNKSTGLIILGGVWCGLAALAGIFIAIGIYTALQFSQSYQTTEFDPAEYDGSTASIVASYTGEATLQASSTGDDYKRYTFKSTNGIFVVPAVEISPESYSITAKDADNKIWSASWSFYSAKEKVKFDLTTNESAEIKADFPLLVSVTRKEMTDEQQNINIQVTDANGNKVSLRAQPAPSIEILDGDENVVWSHKLSYG